MATIDEFRAEGPGRDGGDPAHPGAWRRWLRFVIGLTAILLFAFAVIPWLQELGPVREITAVIEENDIDAAALFYTDSEESSDADAWMRNSLKRRPKK
jgi:hypothetical protein